MPDAFIDAMSIDVCSRGDAGPWRVAIRRGFVARRRPYLQ